MKRIHSNIRFKHRKSRCCTNHSLVTSPHRTCYPYLPGTRQPPTCENATRRRGAPFSRQPPTAISARPSLSSHLPQVCSLSPTPGRSKQRAYLCMAAAAGSRHVLTGERVGLPLCLCLSACTACPSSSHLQPEITTSFFRPLEPHQMKPDRLATAEWLLAWLPWMV